MCVVPVCYCRVPVDRVPVCVVRLWYYKEYVWYLYYTCSVLVGMVPFGTCSYGTHMIPVGMVPVRYL